MNTQLLKNSVVGVDFLAAYYLKQEQPSVDRFLDYRSSLMSERSKGVLDRNWLSREINAVDEIINIINK